MTPREPGHGPAPWFDGPPPPRAQRSLRQRFGPLRRHGAAVGHRAAKSTPARHGRAAAGDGADTGLGDRIALARHEAGLTTKELAQRIDQSVWSTERLEAGAVDAGPHLASIASATATQERWLRQSPDETESTSGDPQPPPAEPSAAAPSPPEQRAVVRLICVALTLLVVIRFFTEVVPVVPRFMNFIDIPIFVVILSAALLRRAPAEQDKKVVPVLLLTYLFVLVCAIATVSNLARVDIAPVLIFIYGFAAPPVLYYAAYRLWPAGSALSLSRLLVALGLVQIFVVATINVPQFMADGDPDGISGTFGENPYQLVFFLLVLIGLLAGIFTFEKERATARFTPVLLLAIVAVIFLAQYRSLLLTTALAIVLLGVLLAPSSARGASIAAVTAAMLLVTLAYVAQNLPALKFGAVIEQGREDPTFYLEKRLETVRVVGTLFGEDARYAITGTGPGTYSSRAWSTFARTSDSESDVAGDYVEKWTGGRVYRTDVSDKYVMPDLRDAEVVSGSYAVDSPFTSYAALLAEVGIVGLAAILAVYLWAMLSSLRMTRIAIREAQPGDPLPALVCASSVAFVVMLQMALLENWLEVTRITFLSWILFAVASKEFNSRRQAT